MQNAKCKMFNAKCRIEAGLGLSIIVLRCLCCLLFIGYQIGHATAKDAASAEGHEIVKVELFRAGRADYQSYRIPSLVITRKGTILAAAAGRFEGHGDWGNIDTMLRRSTDEGKTWDDQQIVTDDGLNTVDNATFIIDPNSDTVYLMYQINYARAYLKRSTDEGLTWSEPQEITPVFEEFRARDGYDWEVLAMGPGHGITTRSGRMIVPVWLSTQKKHRPSVSATIFSDDRGASWKAGEIIVRTNDRTVNPSEHMLVELSDGRIMSNIRSESKQHRRLVSVSEDGAAGWSKPEFVDELYEPICMAGFAAVPPSERWTQGLLLFTHPNSGPTVFGYQPEWGARARRNLTLHISLDDGATWTRSLVIEPGPSGYSDVAASKDGAVLVLYEAGSDKSHGAFAPQKIMLARLSLAELAEGP